MMDNRPIGVLDSGLGGLTVIKAMQKFLPDESFIYVGDSLRAPYGDKDRDTILSYGRELLGFLKRRRVKAVIIACGTISSNVFEEVKAGFDIPIIDVVRPGVKAGIKLCQKKGKERLGVIATEATINSGFFQKLLGESGIEARYKACPLLVPMVEAGMATHTVTKKVISAYLKDWKNESVDALLLGCTHYPILSEPIKDFWKELTLIDMADSAVKECKRMLKQKDMLSDGSKVKQVFNTSGDAVRFGMLGTSVIGNRVVAKKIEWK